MGTDLARCWTLRPLVISLGLLLAGCPASRPPDEVKQIRAEAVDEVKLAVIDKAGFSEALKQNRGNVVLIDFWATWCPECRELFPHTVALHRQFADRGLTVISIAFDEPEDQATALKFLTEKRATCDNFISKYGSKAESYQVFAIPDGALPHLKLYDRNGKLHRTFASGRETIETEEIDRAVKELLGET